MQTTVCIRLGSGGWRQWSANQGEAFVLHLFGPMTYASPGSLSAGAFWCDVGLFTCVAEQCAHTSTCHPAWIVVDSAYVQEPKSP